MKRLLTVVFTLVIGTTSTAQQNDIPKEKFHWGTVKQDTTYGYAGVVKTGNVLYLSGVTAAGDFPTQVRNIYATLENNLQKFGASFQNVVKENLFTTNMDSMKHHAGIRKEFYKGDYPAATWVQITQLFSPDRMLEVEVIAHLPEKVKMPEWPGDKILGTWGMQTKNGGIYETWIKVNQNLYKGKSYQVTGSDTMMLEYVDLKKTKEGVFYIPTTADQNDGNPVTFTLTSAMGNLFIFENPQHDFPKRIGYEFINNETLRAWIDGGPDAANKRSNFNYKRIK
jgi:2-iminobutanoate/2-iminopropanoate deaminase